MNKLRLNTCEYHSQSSSKSTTSVETVQLSVSSMDLSLGGGGGEEMGGGGLEEAVTPLSEYPTYSRRGYDLQCNVFVSYTAELYRVMSVELTRNLQEG